MSGQRSSFAGGDQPYLRDVQYRDPARLAQRANLHATYSTADIAWHAWVSAVYELRASMDVLEAGCGAGWTWAEAATPLPSGISLVLTDLSPGMVETAVERARQTGQFASVTGWTADLQDLPIEADRYDRIIANHMLYHLPDPGRGVAELARVVTADGLVVAATNGHRHMRELWAIRADVFGLSEIDATIEAFGADTGFTILREHFGDIRWRRFEDELHCTDADDVLAYICSTPPGENASQEERRQLRDKIREAIDAGDGVLRVTKDVGCFVCREPLR
ncbi:MAG: class I SAM-dependent methyltransferase [Acidimicrobiia bacterium]|nr:class I SAM-dependent methyltransferase [Acidimicrobiia bacterium]